MQLRSGLASVSALERASRMSDTLTMMCLRSSATLGQRISARNQRRRTIIKLPPEDENHAFLSGPRCFIPLICGLASYAICEPAHRYSKGTGRICAYDGLYSVIPTRGEYMFVVGCMKRLAFDRRIGVCCQTFDRSWITARFPLAPASAARHAHMRMLGDKTSRRFLLDVRRPTSSRDRILLRLYARIWVPP
ncbi:hypothetical protein FA95DRAFT_428943 [Auriscalpium vulgare]|uniref:Uncharacterized protein n=1 Tax=Auriscalpium vulgare TaxID=40419 RepID=A0ACB8RGB7_9AGAM|nr:hypothetical protein FA95DRAFT_428943 [Auriscalpium vulgare]